MSVFVVVKVVDVFERPVTGADVVVGFQDQSPHIKDRKDPGVYEQLLPDSAVEVRVVVAKDGFFTAEQFLKVFRGDDVPTARFDGPQSLNTRSLAVTSRGFSDQNVEVNVVLGQLRDASDSINQSPIASRVTNLNAFSVLQQATPILNSAPGATGAALLNQALVRVNPTGRMFFAERPTVPKLIVILHPGFSLPVPAQQDKTPLPYNVFFPPTVFWPDPYPFGFNYIDFIARYLNEGLTSDFETLPKGFGNQSATRGPKVITVLPVPSLNERMGDLIDEEAVFRLLKEVNYFVQRMKQVPYPRQPMGATALTAFSSGIGDLSRIMGGKTVPEFHDTLLRHIFLLDAAFGSKGGKEDQGNTDLACKRIAAWYRKGTGRRTIRSYTQSRLYLNALGKELPGPVATTTAAGATEMESASGTVLHVPTSFWIQANTEIAKIKPPAKPYNAAHQFIPALFMEHAVGQSDFGP